MQSKLITTNFVVDPAAVTYLRRMPIAPSASFNFTLQVTSFLLPTAALCHTRGSVVPFASTWHNSCCRYSAQIFFAALWRIRVWCCPSCETYLITIRVDNSTSYDQLPAASGNYSYAANFTLTASSSTYYPVASLETVCSLSQNVHAIRNMSMRLVC